MATVEEFLGLALDDGMFWESLRTTWRTVSGGSDTGLLCDTARTSLGALVAIVSVWVRGGGVGILGPVKSKVGGRL
jgi:hypothetical protein